MATLGIETMMGTNIQWGSYWHFYPLLNTETYIKTNFFPQADTSTLKLALETWTKMSDEMFRAERDREKFALWARHVQAELLARRLSA